MFVGGHVYKKGRKLTEMIEKSIENGYSTMQFFTRSPRMIGTKIGFSNSDIIQSKELISESGIKAYVHGGYRSFLVNAIGKPNIQGNIIADLNFIDRVGGAGLVIHVGKNKPVKLLPDLIKTINSILKRANGDQSVLLLENEVQGYSCNFLGKIFKGISVKYKHRIGFCIDTAHLWGKGIVMNEHIDKNLPILWDLMHRKIKLIHLNGSPVEYGSKIDRHCKIFGSAIPDALIKKFVEFSIMHKIPMVLETRPVEDIPKHVKQVKKLNFSI